MGDVSTPNHGLRVNPDGTLEYEFDGHVIARGIDLLAGSNATPPDDRKVRALRESDGARVGEWFGYLQPPIAAANLQAVDPDDPDDLLARAFAVVDTNADRAAVGAAVLAGGAVTAATTIDSDGKSSFPQVWSTGTTSTLIRMKLIPLQVGGTGILGVGGVVSHVVTHNLGHNNYFVVGGVRGNPVNNPSACAWSYHQPNANQVQIQLQNVGGGAINVDNFWGLIVTLQ